MGTYTQWRAGADKGHVRRFMWVCGPERVLVEEVIDRVTWLVNPDIPDHVLLDASIHPEAAIWSAVAQYPSNFLVNRLIVIREAQRLTRWDMLYNALNLSRDLRHLHLVFVSSEPALTKVQDDETQPPKLAHHLAALRDASQGQLVVCTPPSEADLVAWVQGKVPGLGQNLAYYALERCGGDLAQVSGLCAKLALFGPEHLNKTVVDELSVEQSASSFAHNLSLGDKRHALLAASGLTEEELGEAIGLLDARLDMIALLRNMLADGMKVADMPTAQRLMAKDFRKVAPEYTPDRVQVRRSVLAAADSARRLGARDGVAEFVCALW